MDVDTIAADFRIQTLKIEKDFYAALKVNPAATAKVYANTTLGVHIAGFYTLMMAVGIDLELVELTQPT